MDIKHIIFLNFSVMELLCYGTIRFAHIFLEVCPVPHPARTA